MSQSGNKPSKTVSSSVATQRAASQFTRRSLLKGAAADSAIIKGKRYATPTVWGTETLCFNTKSAPLEYGKASYADLWKPEYVGKVTVRPHSSLVGMGLVLEAAGKLPNKMREA